MDCVTSAVLLDDVSPPPTVACAMTAFPPSPPFPPLPLPVAAPPADEAAEVDDESAFPLPLLVTVVLLPPAAPVESSPLEVWAADDVDVPLGVDAPPVAVEVAVLVAGPPAPAEFVLEFVPAPPAPPVRFTDTVLVAELVCVNVLDVVLVLLPEFVPVDEFA